MQTRSVASSSRASLLALLLAGALAGCGNSGSGSFGDGGSSGSGGGTSGSGSGSSGGGTSSTSSTSGSSGGSGSSASGSGSGGSSTSSSSGSSGSTSSSSGSGSGSTHDSGSSCSPKVPSNVTYNDAGVALCGTTACPVPANVCCVNIAGKATCTPAGTGCPTGQAVFKCADKCDCPANEVCCGIADTTSNTAGSACQNVSTTGGKCTPATTSTTGAAQLCQTNAECLAGPGSCVWQDCMVGTLAPSLTMCGIQSQAPFNCTAH